MARPKKPGEKSKEVETLSIDVASFVRTRDSVVTGLATLQDAIRSLSSAYIKHTNAVLGDHEDLAVDLAEAVHGVGSLNPLLASLKGLEPTTTLATKSSVPEKEEKKERKKRQHDANAPKRPLTPYFLYMQTARPIIAQDLGPDVPKGAVSDEGAKRWASMEEHDKALWSDAYKENLRLYTARMHSYKTGGNQNAKNMTDEEALEYATTHNIGVNSADSQLITEASHAEADAEGEAEAEAEEEPEKEPTPPPVKAAPKAKANRKTKSKEPDAIVPPTPSSSTIVPPKAAEKEKEEKATPAGKRKRPSKKGAEEPAAEKEEAAATETPKSGGKPRKKKAKADN